MFVTGRLIRWSYRKGQESENRAQRRRQKDPADKPWEKIVFAAFFIAAVAFFAAHGALNEFFSMF